MDKHIDKEAILKYVTDKLSITERDEVDKHLLTCNICLFKVSHAYSKLSKTCHEARGLFRNYYQGLMNSERLNFMRHHLMVCDHCLQAYNNFVEIHDEVNFTVNALKVVKSQKGLRITLDNTEEGKLVVSLKSDKYDVSDVKVSLGNRGGGMFDVMASAITSGNGRAELGTLDDIVSKRGKDKYSLHVSGLKKKQSK